MNGQVDVLSAADGEHADDAGGVGGVVGEDQRHRGRDRCRVDGQERDTNPSVRGKVRVQAGTAGIVGEDDPAVRAGGRRVIEERHRGVDADGDRVAEHDAGRVDLDLTNPADDAGERRGLGDRLAADRREHDAGRERGGYRTRKVIDQELCGGAGRRQGHENESDRRCCQDPGQETWAPILPFRSMHVRLAIPSMFRSAGSGTRLTIGTVPPVGRTL